MQSNKEEIIEKALLAKKFAQYSLFIIAGFSLLLIVILMILATGEDFDKGCIRDNGTIESSIVSAKGYNTTNTKYNPTLGGGQLSEWRSTGYRSNGQGFKIHIRGKTYTNSLHGVSASAINRCRLCAKPKNHEAGKFKLKPEKVTDSNQEDANREYIFQDEDPNNIDNCLCTQFGIENSNTNEVNNLNIRKEPTHSYDRGAASNDARLRYCTNIDNSNINSGNINDNSVQCPYNSNTHIKSNSNASCTDAFYFDANDDDIYDGADEDIHYNNLSLKYINLDYRNNAGIIKDKNYQETCYYDAGFSAMIGLFGDNGHEIPNKTYHLYSEYYFDDKNIYEYISPNNAIFPGHGSGEIIKLRYNDGYYNDNNGQYNINFIEGIITQDFEGILTKIVKTVEGLFIGDGYLKTSYERIVGNNIFQIIVKLSLIFYIAFSALGMVTGSMDIKRKEFTTRILKVALILFFTSPDSWSWYNDLVVGFFMGAIDIMSQFTLNLNFTSAQDPYLIAVEDKFQTDYGHSSKFAFPDQMIKTFFMSENIFIKLWSLLFSPFNIAGIVIIAGTYAIMIFFIYVMVQIILGYLVSITSVIMLLSIGPIFFISTLSKVTSASFNRWIVYIGARIIEITMIFLVLYIFLSIINNKIGIYGQLDPESLLYFESCPYSLYDLIVSGGNITAGGGGSLSGLDDNLTAPGEVTQWFRNILKSLFSFFRIYISDPTSGIEQINGDMLGGKDFFEMISIIMEVFILLYFLQMIISQVGAVAAATISYQQEKALSHSGAAATAKEGGAMMSAAQQEISRAFKLGSSELLKGGKFALRSASDVTKFAKEHDAIARGADNRFGDTRVGRASKYASQKISSPFIKFNETRNSFHEKKIEIEVNKQIKSIQPKIRSCRSQVIAGLELEKKLHLDKETINKLINNNLDDKAVNNLKKAGANHIDIESQIQSELKGYKADDRSIEKEVRQRSFASISGKDEFIERALKKQFMEHKMEKLLKNLTSEGSLITAPEAAKKLRQDQGLKEKYSGQDFEESLQKAIKRIITDKEVLTKTKIEENNIIDDMMRNKKYNITTTEGYDDLQKDLQDNLDFKKLQQRINEHQSYHRSHAENLMSFKKSDEILNNLTSPQEIQKLPSKAKEYIAKQGEMVRNNPYKSLAAAGAMVPIAIVGIVPVTFGVATFKAARFAYNNKEGAAFLAPRAAYRTGRYVYNNTNIPISNLTNKYHSQFMAKVNRNPMKSKAVAILAFPVTVPVIAISTGAVLSRSIYKTTYSSHYKLKDIANKGDNKELAKRRKLTESEILSIKEDNPAYEQKLQKFLGKNPDRDISSLTEKEKQELIKEFSEDYLVKMIGGSLYNKLYKKPIHSNKVNRFSHEPRHTPIEPQTVDDAAIQVKSDIEGLSQIQQNYNDYIKQEAEKIRQETISENGKIDDIQRGKIEESVKQREEAKNLLQAVENAKYKVTQGLYHSQLNEKEKREVISKLEEQNKKGSGELVINLQNIEKEIINSNQEIKRQESDLNKELESLKKLEEETEKKNNDKPTSKDEAERTLAKLKEIQNTKNATNQRIQEINKQKQVIEQALEKLKKDKSNNDIEFRNLEGE